MSEILESLEQLENEKHINKEVIIEAIESSLVTACNNDFGKTAVVSAHMDRDTGDISVFLQKTVVSEVEDPVCQISLEDARMMYGTYDIDDVVNIPVVTKDFGRIAAQHARSVIVQKIKEEERLALFKHFAHKEKDIVTGVVQRFSGKNICVSIDDKTDAILTEKEQVKGEVYHVTDRIKLYIVEVKPTSKAPRIVVSRTHPELVRKLFEREISEVADGTVEIKTIAREAGSRTKIAVSSMDPNVDPVGSCVGLNGARVNAIVDELNGEKIDIIAWDDDPKVLIEHALSPSKVVMVKVKRSGKMAKVVVPDNQLSLAIGKEGQNARLAARLTGYKIDIKSESQAALMPEDFYMDEPEEEITAPAPEVADKAIDEIAAAKTEIAEAAENTDTAEISETAKTTVTADIAETAETTETAADELLLNTNESDTNVSDTFAANIDNGESHEEEAFTEVKEQVSETEEPEASEASSDEYGYFDEDFTIDDFDESDFIEDDSEEYSES